MKRLRGLLYSLVVGLTVYVGVIALTEFSIWYLRESEEARLSILREVFPVAVMMGFLTPAAIAFFKGLKSIGEK